MKLLAIGDIHGRDYWRQINLDNHDKVVFIGDYVDSSVVNEREQYANLLAIINLKKRFSDKIELLLGNHDIHYMLYGFVEPCMGFNVQSYRKFRDVFLENKRLFNNAYQHKNYLFSHAGISNQWWDWINRNSEVEAIFEKSNTIAEGLNLLYLNRDHYNVLHSVGESRGGSQIGGIFWADISDTKEDQLAGFHQVVGHSKVDKITDHKSSVDTTITYIDILDSNKVFELEI